MPSRHEKERKRRTEAGKAMIRERAKGRIHQSQQERDMQDQTDSQAFNKYFAQLHIDEAAEHRRTHFANGEKKLPAHVAAIKQIFEHEREDEKATYKHLQDVHKKIDKVFPAVR
jgi:hypothetical protein